MVTIATATSSSTLLPTLPTPLIAAVDVGPFPSSSGPSLDFALNAVAEPLLRKVVVASPRATGPPGESGPRSALAPKTIAGFMHAELKETRATRDDGGGGGSNYLESDFLLAYCTNFPPPAESQVLLVF